MRRQLGMALIGVTLTSVLGATGVFGFPNPGGGGGPISEFAAGVVDFDLYDGIRGNMGIRTDPSTAVGVAYVHPVQVDLPGTTDFVAIGTVKGAAAGSSSCTDHYDPGADWTGYVDRRINNVYVCSNFDSNAWTTGDNPTFRIEYTYCPVIGNRWVMTFDGVRRSCISSGNTQGTGITAALEAWGSTDRNLDVKYTNMEKNHPGSLTWTPMGDTRCCSFADDFYTYQYVSTTAFNVYLAPLN